MKFNFMKRRKRGSKPSATGEEVNSLVTPTDEEVQFGFDKPASNNSPEKKEKTSPIRKETNIDKVSETKKSVRDSKKQTERDVAGDSEKSISPKKNTTTPQKRSKRRPPSSSFSSSSSSASRGSHEPVRHYKHQARQPYVNGRLSSIDEELSRNHTRSRSGRNLAASSSKLERNNSRVTLNNWVQVRKTKQQHRISEPPMYNSSTLYHNGEVGSNWAPRRGRRHQIQSHSDFMDGNEPASSILSVPIIRHQKVTSLPRPRSSQELNQQDNNNRTVVNWKSVGYLSPDNERETVRMTSEQVLARNQNHFATSARGSASTQSLRRLRDTNITSPQPRTPSFFEAITPNGNQAFRFDQTNQVQHQNKITSPSRKIEEDENDVEIEEKLNRLARLEAAYKQLCGEYEKNKSKEISSSLSNSRDFKSRTFRIIEKLKLLHTGCGTLHNEIETLKKERIHELNRDLGSKSRRHQLEWSFGRIQIALEKLNEMNEDVKRKQETLKNANTHFDEQNEDVFQTSNGDSSTDRTSSDSKSPAINQQRSPLTPKVRFATDIRTSQDKRFFTLPSRGVYRTVSSTSLGSGSVARFVRPLSSSSTTQSSDLQRSKSAAERLFSGSLGNLATGRDPDEIKKIQREISRNRRRTLSIGMNGKPSSIPTNHTQVGMDMKMAMKNYRMPKVLQRSKQQRAEIERATKRDHTQRITSDPGPDASSNVNAQQATLKSSLRPSNNNNNNKDDNLTQLIDIENNVVPRARLLKSTGDLSQQEQYDLEKKIIAIERVMPRNGQNAFEPSNARLAAALAAEAASVSKIMSCQVQPNENSCFA